MPSFALRQGALCIPLILGYLPLAAQSSSYHLEFESQGLVLVNDSEKVIEAYSVRQTWDRGAPIHSHSVHRRAWDKCGYQVRRTAEFRRWWMASFR
jgi:hypothetical protein